MLFRCAIQLSIRSQQWVESGEKAYLPFVEEHKRISTFRGYRNMWRCYLKTRCDMMLREFRTVDGERILESIAKEHKLTSTTLAHIGRSFRGFFSTPSARV